MNKFSKFHAEVICEMHPLFKGLIWVAAARSTDETRPALCNIHVEREGLLCHIVATDGRRIHVHTYEPGMFCDDIAMIEPGLYEVIAKTGKLIVIAPSESGEKYPNWRGVFPDDYEPEHSDPINAMTIGKMSIRTGVLLSVDFVTDAIGFSVGRKKDGTAVVEYGSTGKHAAFVIRHDLGKAIVMPLRDDEDDAGGPFKSGDDAATPDLPGIPEVEIEVAPVMTGSRKKAAK